MPDDNTQSGEDTGEREAVKAPAKPPVMFRGVHYVRDDYSHVSDESKPGEHVGATIIAIHDDEAVTLVGEGFQASPVAHDEGGSVGTWHWPEPKKES